MPSIARRSCRHRDLVLAIAAALLVAPCVSSAQSVPGAVVAREQHRFDIPAQALADALQAFARQSRQQVAFDTAALDGLSSRPVHGASEPGEALRTMLEGTGIEATQGARGVWLIRPGRSTPPSTSSDAAEMETVVVTGTHIRAVAPTGSPLVVIDAEDIRRSGYSGTEQLLQSLPQNFRGGEAGASADVNLSTGSQRGFNMTAGSGVNLRGLGANATLVLVNGRRLSASSGGTFTDISMIPLDAIERIEVLTDGASAVYGADAVAGVVNIILKSDYDSAETRLSYGATTEAGRDEYRISHSAGHQWEGGNLMVTADYLDQSQLLASERSFTADVPGPTSVLPSNRMASLLLSGSHALSDALTVKGDVQYSRARRFSVTTSGSGRSESDITPVRRNAAVTLDYGLSAGWDLALDLFASDEVARSRLHAFRPDGTPNYDYLHTRTQEQHGAELRSNGRLLELPGGPVRVALGVGYKTEDYSRMIDLYGLEQRADRRNTSAFTELHVPLVGQDNPRPGVHRLALSLAVRHDDYSDFGSTRNPRIGLAWSPTPRLGLRASYSTSFRAPAIGEEARFSENGLVGAEIQAFPSAEGDAWVPVLIWLGSDPLQPELARNRSVGLDWKPAFAEGLSLGMTWYDIDYTDRIVLPPFELGILSNPAYSAFIETYDDPATLRALVEAEIARGLPFYDYSGGEFGADPLDVTTTSYRYMWTNAQRVETSGLDVDLRYPFRKDDHRFELGLAATYIQRMETQLAPSSPVLDLVGTYANPPSWRLRGAFSWSWLGLSTAINVNHSDAYVDTTGLEDRAVRSYTTVDLVARYMFAAGQRALTDGLSLSLNVVNLFDEQPPYILASGRGSHYDPANASPLGRMVSLQVARRW